MENLDILIIVANIGIFCVFRLSQQDMLIRNFWKLYQNRLSWIFEMIPAPPLYHLQTFYF